MLTRNLIGSRKSIKLHIYFPVILIFFYHIQTNRKPSEMLFHAYDKSQG